MPRRRIHIMIIASTEREDWEGALDEIAPILLQVKEIPALRVEAMDVEEIDLPTITVQ